jgi:hypothetical protein
MNAEKLNPLKNINFEKKYAATVTLIMVASAIILVGLILFGDLNNNYANHGMFLIISFVDICIFIDVISLITVQKIKTNLKEQEE